jgi:hypothetical protein
MSAGFTHRSQAGIKASLAQIVTWLRGWRYPGTMIRSRNNRGWIASSLVLAAITAMAGFAGGVRTAEMQDPKRQVAVNPAQQRIDMIQHLQSIDTRMASVEASLKNLERAASAGLQLMMKEEKRQQKPASIGTDPHNTPNPPSSENKTTGPR